MSERNLHYNELESVNNDYCFEQSSAVLRFDGLFHWLYVYRHYGYPSPSIDNVCVHIISIKKL
jgi:hypothetical protein